MNDNFKHSEISEKILKAYYTVYNKLGYGFLEKVYERAMLVELRKMELEVASQVSIDVFYDGECVGNYFADILVEKKIILELKAGAGLAEEHEAQLINYLRATDIEVGLLLNFGVKPSFKRKAFSNAHKS